MGSPRSLSAALSSGTFILGMAPGGSLGNVAWRERRTWGQTPLIPILRARRVRAHIESVHFDEHSERADVIEARPIQAQITINHMYVIIENESRGRPVSGSRQISFALGATEMCCIRVFVTLVLWQGGAHEFRKGHTQAVR